MPRDPKTELTSESNARRACYDSAANVKRGDDNLMK